MIRRVTEDKSIFKLKIIKEVVYILLLVTFFTGVIIGSIGFRSVDSSSFEEYSEYLNGIILNYNMNNLNSNVHFYSGIKIIAIFWVAGMSIIGTPVLVGYLWYKGYSLGYSISSIIRVLGVKAGNVFIFKYLFLKNLILVFIMIFLANFSIKTSKNFFEKRTNLKADSLKYSIVTCFMLGVWIVTVIIEKIIFKNL